MAVNFHISKDGNLVTIRHIKDSFDMPTPVAEKFIQVPRYQQDFNTNSFPLTASNPSGNNIKIVRSDGFVVINSVPYTSLKTGTNNANIGATAAATVSTLNGTNFFGAGSIDDDVSSNTSGHTNNNSTIQSNLGKITSLENAVKTATGDRGVYVTNSKDETASKVKLTSTTAKLQAGAKTGIEADESSPGTITFTVAAGASGSEVETTALTIAGTTAGRTTHTFVGDTVSFKANASATGGRIGLNEASDNGTNILTLAAPNSLTAATTLTFPDGAGSNGQVLSTNGSGTLSWVDQSGSGSVSIHAGASDILRAVSGQIGASTNLTSTIAADRLVFYDHSATKLTALELGTNLAISGTTLNATDTNTNLGNANLALAGDRTLDLGGYRLTVRSSSSQNQESLIIEDDGIVTIGPGSSQGGAVLRIREAAGNGSNYISLQAADSLSTNLEFTLPSADGSAGQFLKTDGSGGLSFATPTDTNTNLGNTNLGLSSGTRTLSLSNTNTSFRIMTGQGTPFQVTNTSGNGGKVSINGDFRVDSGALSGGLIKLEENPQGGSNFVALQAPNSISSDLTFTLPATDGSSGQFLQTDGSGNLSFASASGSGGGDGNHYLGQFGGLFTWSSSDDGERVGLHSTYGPYFYSHSTEVDQAALKNYDASQAVDSATSTMDNYRMMIMGFQVHTTDKKVKCIYSFRIQSAPSGSTWGISLWGGTLDTSGSANSERTVTLRGKTSDITASTLSTVVYHGEFTTTSNINGGSIIPFLENRTGSLTASATRIYGSFKLYLCD